MSTSVAVSCERASTFVRLCRSVRAGAQSTWRLHALFSSNRLRTELHTCKLRKVLENGKEVLVTVVDVDPHGDGEERDDRKPLHCVLFEIGGEDLVH